MPGSPPSRHLNPAVAVEALVLLALFRLSLAIVPVRRILSAVTHGPDTSDHPPAPLSDRELAAARMVQRAVYAVTRRSPAKFVCFPQSLVAYTMLRRRGVASTLVYGVTRSPESDLIAHTWVELGDGFIVGGEESGAFTPIERWT